MNSGGGGAAPRATTCAIVVVFFFCAAAAALFLQATFSMHPCGYSLSRKLAAITGLDPYIVSCTDYTPLSESDGGADVVVGGPIVTDLRTCGKPKLPAHATPPFQCCPPASSSRPVEFTPPDPAAQPLRVRRPAHAAGAAEHMAKYERAVALMKALPPSDPRSFYQQANIHCAYCTGAYRQAAHRELNVQIHFSWLFFPFHRAYLYFFERIAGKLLGDPEFAVPFWSWDVPEGMTMPPPFANSSSPIYDPVRNRGHAPPTIVDLDYTAGEERNLTGDQQVQYNLRLMYKQMVSNAGLPSLFHGQPFRAGEADMPGAGTVELSPHNTMHIWVGDLALPHVENMGVYYSAARDPIFYAHHGNIDRLWEAWRRIGSGSGGGGGGRRHVDFTDPDWLDSSFLFYDEEAILVSIKVRDVLDVEKLRYTYEDVPLPWLDAKPLVTPGVKKRGAKGSSPGLVSVRFPVTLGAAAVTAAVRRPGVLRRPTEKVVREEVLVVDGIRSDGDGSVKFDVYVNAAEHEKVEPGGREMAGSFVGLEHPTMDGGVAVETSMRVALNELLEDLGADGDESVTVTLVPRRGKVRIGGLRIEYMVE